MATSISFFNGNIFIDGVLVTGAGLKQKVELRTTKLVLIGSCDAATFSVQKKKQVESI